MTDEQMADLADAAANAAIAHIQKALGIKTGDVAAHHFSRDDAWTDMTTILFDYIRAQNDQSHITNP